MNQIHPQLLYSLPPPVFWQIVFNTEIRNVAEWKIHLVYVQGGQL